MYKIQVLLIFLLATVSATAQPCSVSIEKIDATPLPRMKMETPVQWNGNRLPNVQGLALSVIENGVTLPADVWCPDTASGTLRLYALDGTCQIEHPVAITSEGAIDARIDLSDLHPGSYTVMLRAGDQFLVQTIVKL